MGKEWDEDLFGCFSDVPLAIVVGCLPGALCCVQAISVDKVTHEGKGLPCLLVTCLLPIGGALNRETIRKKLDLNGNFFYSLVTVKNIEKSRDVNEIK